MRFQEPKSISQRLPRMPTSTVSCRLEVFQGPPRGELSRVPRVRRCLIPNSQRLPIWMSYKPCPKKKKKKKKSVTRSDMSIVQEWLMRASYPQYFFAAVSYTMSSQRVPHKPPTVSHKIFSIKSSLAQLCTVSLARLSLVQLSPFKFDSVRSVLLGSPRVTCQYFFVPQESLAPQKCLSPTLLKSP